MNNNFAMDVVADQIDVVGRGIMGISVACARCHDHKFDPVPTKEYYALAGIFTSTETMWGTAAHEKLTAPATDLHVLKTAPKAPPPEGFVETVLVLESNTGQTETHSEIEVAGWHSAGYGSPRREQARRLQDQHQGRREETRRSRPARISGCVPV